MVCEYSPCQTFRGTLGAKVVVRKAADPGAKGLLEWTHDHLEHSFLPGRMFDGPGGLQPQLAAWFALASLPAGPGPAGVSAGSPPGGSELAA